LRLKRESWMANGNGGWDRGDSQKRERERERGIAKGLVWF